MKKIMVVMSMLSVMSFAKGEKPAPHPVPPSEQLFLCKSTEINDAGYRLRVSADASNQAKISLSEINQRGIRKLKEYNGSLSMDKQTGMSTAVGANGPDEFQLIFNQAGEGRFEATVTPLPTNKEPKPKQKTVSDEVYCFNWF